MYMDTITAISTSLGEAAIGIIRISGEEAFSITNKIFKASSGKTHSEYGNRQLIYGHIYDGELKIDEVLVAYMKKPSTYTCEDIVEINCHGSRISLGRILELILKNGARMAEAGEFTKRAFLNGRLDLAQAESVMDLLSAKTPQGFDVAMNQLEGQLSYEVSDLRQEMLEVMSQLEVSIDYPEEDIEEITFPEVEKSLKKVKTSLGKLLRTAEAGKIYRDGISTAIVGKPNVGKSSLMNALLRESRAIVTDIPGTTRDLIEEYLNIKGIPLKITDTAGIRDTEDHVEKIGVERSKALFNQSDLVIFVINMAEKLTEEDYQIIELIKDRNAILIFNKSDLEKIVDIDYIRKELPDKPIIYASMMDKSGIEEIEDKIIETVLGNDVQTADVGYISNVRHIQAIKNAQESIDEALTACNDRMPYDFIQVDVKNTLESIGEITGDTVEDDLINKIFSNFCLGK